MSNDNNILQGTLSRDANEASSYFWFINCDKIFSSKVPDFKDSAVVQKISYGLSKEFLYENDKQSDNILLPYKVKVYLFPGLYCAELQNKVLSKKPLSKILIKKVLFISEKFQVWEEKEFSDCVIDSFQREGELVIFTFRYTKFSDKYTEYDDMGVKKGSSAANVDLMKWEGK